MNRWEFRADQLQLLYQQAQTELLISILVASVVTAIFWNIAPPKLMLGWTLAIIVFVGMRSLFISSRIPTANRTVSLSGVANILLLPYFPVPAGELSESLPPYLVTLFTSCLHSSYLPEFH